MTGKTKLNKEKGRSYRVCIGLYQALVDNGLNAQESLYCLRRLADAAGIDFKDLVDDKILLFKPRRLGKTRASRTETVCRSTARLKRLFESKTPQISERVFSASFFPLGRVHVHLPAQDLRLKHLPVPGFTKYRVGSLSVALKKIGRYIKRLNDHRKDIKDSVLFKFALLGYFRLFDLVEACIKHRLVLCVMPGK